MENMDIGDKLTIGKASVYKKTYYYNKFFDRLPDAVKEEIQNLCTFYSAKLHCVFSVKFRENGDVYFETQAEDWDMNYDEIGASLDMNKLARERRELFLSLKMWYLVFVLGVAPEDVQKRLLEDESLDG